MTTKVKIQFFSAVSQLFYTVNQQGAKYIDNRGTKKKQSSDWNFDELTTITTPPQAEIAKTNLFPNNKSNYKTLILVNFHYPSVEIFIHHKRNLFEQSEKGTERPKHHDHAIICFPCKRWNSSGRFRIQVKGLCHGEFQIFGVEAERKLYPSIVSHLFSYYKL